MHLRTVAMGTLVALAAQDVTLTARASYSVAAPMPTRGAGDFVLPLNPHKREDVKSSAIPEIPIGSILAVDASRRGQDTSPQAYQDAAIAVGVPNGPQSYSGAIATTFASKPLSPTAAIATWLSDAQGHPRFEFIAALQARGVLEEFENGNFAPETPMTKAEFASLIEKAFPAPGDRRGISADFIAAGGESSSKSALKKTQPISRLEVLETLVKKLKLQAKSGTHPDLNSYFQDAAEIPDEAMEEVAVAIANNLVVNQPHQPLPKLNQVATKADVAGFLYQAWVATGEVSPPEQATISGDAPILQTSNQLSERQAAWKDSSIRVSGLQRRDINSPSDVFGDANTSPAPNAEAIAHRAYRIPPIEVSTPATAASISDRNTTQLAARAASISDRLDALRNSMQGYQTEKGSELPPLGAPDRYLPNSADIFQGYMWPAQGVLTSGYGWRWGRMHKGIDIAGPIGTPIFAAAPGVVTYAAWDDGGYGNLVEIQHPDGSLTRYAHNDRILVREGQQVAQGQQISEMGSTGNSTGPHLHFEVYPPGQGAVDPMAYLPDDRGSFATSRKIGQGGP